MFTPVLYFSLTFIKVYPFISKEVCYNDNFSRVVSFTLKTCAPCQAVTIYCLFLFFSLTDTDAVIASKALLDSNCYNDYLIVSQIFLSFFGFICHCLNEDCGQTSSEEEHSLCKIVFSGDPSSNTNSSKKDAIHFLLANFCIKRDPDSSKYAPFIFRQTVAIFL